MTNRKINGKIFTPDIIERVWEKAEVVPGYNPDDIRKDICGAFIKKDMYGIANTSLSMGWEIDHIKPRSIGGMDELSNLQPLQWENNKHKNDHYPSWTCKVVFKITENQYN